MVNTILLDSELGFGEMLFLLGGLGYLILWGLGEKKKQAQIEEAYRIYQKALNGTDKKDALAKGRFYVSLLPVKKQMLAEVSIQNDLLGMDDAIKIKK